LFGYRVWRSIGEQQNYVTYMVTVIGGTSFTKHLKEQFNEFRIWFFVDSAKLVQ
jgi:hypothetical protein